MIAMRALNDQARPRNDSERCGRALGEERRRLREPPLGAGRDRAFAARYREIEYKVGLRCARRERAEHVAADALVGGFAAEVDQPTVLGVLQRMQQRGLPAGKQRYDEENPR
jgi:hypothetical protein